MPFINLNNIDLYYELHGQGEPLVLISGFAADHTVWEVLLPLLSEHFTVIIFDNRCAGQSEISSESFSILDMATDVRYLLDHLNIKQAHVLGQSMGSQIAQYLAVEYPSYVNKLILANGFAKLNTLCRHVFLNLEQMIDANVAKSIMIEALIPWCYSNESLASLDQYPWLKKRFEFFYNNPHPQTKQGFKQQLAAVSESDTQAILPNIKQDTLIIAAEYDFLIPLSEAMNLLQTIPNARLEVMPQLGHMSHNERPTEFVEIVKEFLL